MTGELEPEGDADAGLTEDLSDEQQRELALRGYVQLETDVVWRTPDGRIRREPVANLYYIDTTRGIFRVSRLHGRVIEV